MIHQMDFERYQIEVSDITMTPDVVPDDALLFWAVGLTGESGEVANIVKKFFYKRRQLDEITKQCLTEELGDVLWYVAAIANCCDINLQQVAYENLDKVAKKIEAELNDFTNSIDF